MSDFKLNFIHLCDEAQFSQEGKLSLIGIFDVINLVSLPGNLLKAVLVFNMSVLNTKVNKIDLDIAIVKNKGNQSIFNLPTIKTDVPKTTLEQNTERKMGLKLQLGNLTFREEGGYDIEVSVNKNLLGKYRFFVKQIKKGVSN